MSAWTVYEKVRFSQPKAVASQLLLRLHRSLHQLTLHAPPLELVALAPPRRPLLEQLGRTLVVAHLAGLGIGLGSGLG